MKVISRCNNLGYCGRVKIIFKKKNVIRKIVFVIGTFFT